MLSPPLVLLRAGTSLVKAVRYGHAGGYFGSGTGYSHGRFNE